MPLHCVKTHNTSNRIHRRHIGKAWRSPCTNIYHNRKFREEVLSVQAPSSINNDTLKISSLVQQIMTELSEAVLERRI
jgi:hypothetical protein